MKFGDITYYTTMSRLGLDDVLEELMPKYQDNEEEGYRSVMYQINELVDDK